ncbi:MAG: methyltransferase [Halobacteriales archaeon]
MKLAELRGESIDVYGPAEDSALLASVAADLVDPSDYVLDVGTGSGYIAAKVIDTVGATVVGSDINPHACRRARSRDLSVVRADLTAAFRTGVFDVVLFNPPYLPNLVTDITTGDDSAGEPTMVSTTGGESIVADDIDQDPDWLERAVTGGETGRAVIEPFLDDVGRVLTADGYVLILVSSVTGVEAVVEYAGQRGFHTVACRDVTYPGETLTVLKLVR